MPRRRLAAPRPPHVRTPREKLAGRVTLGRFVAEAADRRITGRAEPMGGAPWVRVYLDDGRSGTGQVTKRGTISLTIAGDFSETIGSSPARAQPGASETDANAKSGRSR